MVGNQTGSSTTAGIEIDVVQDWGAEYFVYGKITSNGQGLPNVAMEGLPSTPTTSIDGNYISSVPAGWSGTVSPILEGYNFDPPVLNIAPLQSNLKINFRSTIKTYTISGWVSMDNQGVPGVKIQGLPEEVATDQKGRFHVIVNHGWSATLTPVKENYVFSPQAIELQDVVNDQSIEFLAKQLKSNIEIELSDGDPIHQKELIRFVTEQDRQTVELDFIIRNKGNTDLLLTGSPTVFIQDNPASAFQVSLYPVEQIAPGASTSFMIAYDQESACISPVTVIIECNDPENNPYYFYLAPDTSHPLLSTLILLLLDDNE